MGSHKHAGFMSRAVARIGISPRLIIILSLFGIALMLLALALLYAPLAVLSAAILAGLAVDKRAWIKRQFQKLKGNRQAMIKGGKSTI